MKNIYSSALIVEDDNDLRKLLGKIVAEKVHSVLSSATLANAEAIVKANRPDFIILDNDLPDGKGAEKISRFRQLCPAAAIVLVSALPNLKEEAAKHGADGYVEKPLKISDIQDLLDRKLK